MLQRNLLLLFLLFIGFSACQTEQAEEPSRPNILFIMSDDHAYQAISAYSDRLIQTPNIDRLADEGILFSNACVTNSICAPSRAVILTGKHSHINGKPINEVGLFISGPWDRFNNTFCGRPLRKV